MAEGDRRAARNDRPAVGNRAPAGIEVGPVRLRTLTLIRWVGVIGQAAAVSVVELWLDFRVPVVPCLVVIGASALVNFAATVVMLERPRAARLGERGAALFLAYDIVQLAALLYLTGGLQNPFAVLLLAPVSVSATILGGRPTMALSALSIAAITTLAVYHLPLPWREGGLTLPLLYVLGIWAALATGIVFFATYAFRVAAEARRMSDALAAAQFALSRERQLSALGALAAAAAHELGSPLGTISVAAREIAHDLPPGSPIAGDVDLLISEAARCRDILARLAARTDDDDQHFLWLPIAAIAELAAAPHLRAGIEVVFASGPAPGAALPQPTARRSPEILHGLGNLIQNAVQIARQRVEVTTRWSDADVTMTIADDGPGFPPGMIERLGEPYVSSRRDGERHMGLGIFIAQTLLGRTGAALAFGNRSSGGAEVAVLWNRVILEAAGADSPADPAAESLMER